MRVALINNYPDGHGEERIRRLSETIQSCGARLETFHFDAIPEGRLERGDFDCLVLSGSNLDVTNPEDLKLYAAEVELIRKTRLPVLAICYGHQLAAHAYGASVGRNVNTGEWGNDIELNVQGDVENILGAPRVWVNVKHKDFVASDDPQFLKSFEVRAISIDGPFRYVQYARHRERPIFSVQFHPECFDHTRPQVQRTGRDIIANFLDFARGAKGAPAR